MGMQVLTAQHGVSACKIRKAQHLGQTSVMKQAAAAVAGNRSVSKGTMRHVQVPNLQHQQQLGSRHVSFADGSSILIQPCTWVDVLQSKLFSDCSGAGQSEWLAASPAACSIPL
jgi:hypothetical protein